MRASMGTGVDSGERVCDIHETTSVSGTRGRDLGRRCAVRFGHRHGWPDDLVDR